MLDRFAIHVANEQAAVGAERHLHGAEPNIFRANKLGVLIDPIAAISDAIGHEPLAMDQIAAHVGSEHDRVAVCSAIGRLRKP